MCVCVCVCGERAREKLFERRLIKSIAGGSADDRIDEEKDNEKMNRITGKQRTDQSKRCCLFVLKLVIQRLLTFLFLESDKYINT